jgi:hypothetical protein
MSELIYGCNPFTISRATWKPGRRHGAHPYKDVLYARKLPILHQIFGGYQALFDGWHRPEVRIIGPAGDVLLYTECKSNAEAVHIRGEIKERLNTFLSDLKREVK